MRFLCFRYLRPLLILLLIQGLVPFVAYAIEADAGTGVEVIVHPGVSNESLSLGRLRVIFSMRVTRWSNSQPIHVFVLPGNHPLHQRFVKNVLKLFPHQLQSAWDRMVYSGTGVAPTVVSSVEEMRARIASTPGAIGYVNSPEGGMDE
jgi:ABC-type phosphate transport system substrate-binding protein